MGEWWRYVKTGFKIKQNNDLLVLERDDSRPSR
jgi:hypothetical protein